MSNNYRVDSRDIYDVVKQYRDTKTIFSLLVTTAAENTIKLRGQLFRGDCTYPSLIKEGNIYKFHNPVSSWTCNHTIANMFTNTESVPEWYTSESEWYQDYAYPFTKNIQNKEEIVPVIFCLNSQILHGIVTSDYIDVDRDKDYVQVDEQEVILKEDTFVIKQIKWIYGIAHILLEADRGEDYVKFFD